MVEEKESKGRSVDCMNGFYKLGYYTESGDQETLAACKTRAEAREIYAELHKQYNCTIWVQFIQLIDGKDL